MSDSDYPPTPLESPDIQDYFDETYVKFINRMELEDVYEIMCDANYLKFKGLLHLCGAKIAASIKQDYGRDQTNFTNRR